MKIIPLNSVVFLVDVSQEQVSDMFESYEFVSYDSIQLDMVGPHQNRPDLATTIISEVSHRMFSKLMLGERVVIDIPDLRRESRITLAKEALSRGFDVFYLVDDLSIRRDLMSGDRIASVVDLNIMPATVIKSIPDSDFFKEIRIRGYQGITVVPDVHGNLNSMRNAITWAKNRNHFLLFLGDLLDYGIDTLEVIDVAYQLVIRGEAEVIMGNHEKKIFRYLSATKDKAHNIRLSDGNKVTINRIKELSNFDNTRWVNRFKALVSLMRNHRTSDGFIFTHGAVTQEMFLTNARKLSGEMASVSLFGETDDSIRRSDGFPNRVYNWVNKLLPHQIAIVGHDIRSNFEPLTVVGDNGGTALFMDTGCGKGGHLSTVDIRLTDASIKIGNFNIH